MTDLSRRSVLGATASGVAVAVVGVPAAPDLAVAAPLPAHAVPAARGYTRERSLYRRKRFAKLRTKKFTVVVPGGRMRMTLVRVANIQGVEKGSKRSFELTFAAPRKGPVQGTYLVERRRFAATSLFLVPTDDTRRTYRAVVNNR